MFYEEKKRDVKFSLANEYRINQCQIYIYALFAKIVSKYATKSKLESKGIIEYIFNYLIRSHWYLLELLK